MSSGIKPSAELADLFIEMQMIKKGEDKGNRRKVLVLKIDHEKDKPDIIVDPDFTLKTGEEISRKSQEKDMSLFKTCLHELPKNEGRYVVFDYDYLTNSGVENSKLISILWCPSEITVKQKMMYASSKDALKGLARSELPHFQADCIDDIDEKTIESRLKKGI